MPTPWSPRRHWVEEERRLLAYPRPPGRSSWHSGSRSLSLCLSEQACLRPCRRPEEEAAAKSWLC